MKVIGICGSPRRGGNTEIMLRTTLEEIEKNGTETELVLLAEKNIMPCKGHSACLDKCPQNDDIQAIYSKAEQADAIIIATPVWSNNVSSLTKIFIDRFLWTAMNGKKLLGKKFGVITVGQYKHGGHEMAFNVLKNWSTDQGLQMIGDKQKFYSKFGAIGFGKKPGDVKKDLESIESARKLGQEIVKETKK
ncbi:flavodoxin family protein [archaeon]|nr:flavodoxin family protein [archaeon]